MNKTRTKQATEIINKEVMSKEQLLRQAKELQKLIKQK